MDGERAYQTTADRPETAIDLLDVQITRLENNLDNLRKKVEPIVSRYETEKELSAPRAEPRSDLAGRAERLLDLNLRLERITAELDI